MKYIGYFRDINNSLYSVEIETKNGITSKELTLGGSPFTTEMSGDGTIYSPIKYSGATLEIVSEDYLFDLYNAKAHDVKVILYEHDEIEGDKTVRWLGYVEPVLYSQGYEYERETIQVNCIDGLSTLKYLKMETHENTNLNIADFIGEILGKCGYVNYYFPENIKYNSTDPVNETFLDKLYINQEAFFKDKKADEKPEDVALTLDKVLESLCNFLGVSAIGYGNSVIFLDYDGIIKDKNTYHEYDIINKVQKNHACVMQGGRKITARDYAESGANLSLEPVYNKFKVVAKTRENKGFDMNDYFDENNPKTHQITKDCDYKIESAYSAAVRIDGFSNSSDQIAALSSTQQINAGTNKTANTQLFFDFPYNITNTNYNNINYVAARYLNNEDVECYQYKFSAIQNTSQYDDYTLKFEKTETATELNYSDTMQLTGGYMAQYSVINIPETKYVKTLTYKGTEDGKYIFDEPDNYNAICFAADIPGKNWVECFPYGGLNYQVYNGKVLSITFNPEIGDPDLWKNYPTYDAHSAGAPWFVPYEPEHEQFKIAHDNIQSRFLINDIKLNNYFVLSTPEYRYGSGVVFTTRFIDESTEFIKLKPKTISCGVGGDNTYLIISGKISWDCDKNTYQFTHYLHRSYPVSAGHRGYPDNGQYVKTSNELYIACKLHYNGMSWNGNSWVEDAEKKIIFPLYYGTGGSTNEERKLQNIMSKEHDIRNSVYANLNFGDKKGTVIPIPKTWGILNETPEFVFCAPHTPEPNNYGEAPSWLDSLMNGNSADERGDWDKYMWLAQYVFIKDFKIEFICGTDIDNKDDDTVYTNSCGNDSVNESSEIEFNVNTFDGKKLSYTNVLKYNNDTNQYSYLGNFFNTALIDGEKAWFDNNEIENTGLKSEEHFIYKHCNQYKNPAIKLELTLKNICKSYGVYKNRMFNDRKFIVNSQNIDFRNNSQTITLIEKF